MDDHTHSATARAPGAKELFNHLQAEITNGKLHAGVKLPPERELSQRFSISRGSVRRVLADLRARGLIVQSVGSGTFVAPGAATRETGTSIPAIDTSPAELMEARLLIEPLMPALIARNATAADFAHMQRCLEASEAASTIETFEHWDGELHRTFAVATHNAFFLQILELTNRVREQGEWGRLKRKSLTPERRAQYERQHRAIVDALKDRDAAHARELLVVHLRQIQGNLFE